MVDFRKSLVNKIISGNTFIQLNQLWQQTTEECKGMAIFLTEKNLLPEKTSKKDEKIPLIFKLIITDKFQSLLLVEKTFSGEYYQVSILFEKSEIINFINLIKNRVKPNVKSKLNLILKEENYVDTVIEKFVFNLSNILNDSLNINENHYELNDYNSANLILKNILKEEEILNQISAQIEQNLDLFLIINTTMEQVRKLLKIDRLTIYQFDLFLPEENNLCDVITYETRISDIIPSILHRIGNHQFDQVYKNNSLYLESLSLIIDDINDPKLNFFDKNLMKELNIKSTIITPIFVNKKLWGLLIADQCFTKKKWTEKQVTFLRNISEYMAIAIYQSESNQKLKDQKKRLEEKVEKTTKELEETFNSNQITNQSKNDFLGNISHELRTPLTSIIGLSGTLLYWSKKEKNLSKEKQKHYLEIIQESGRKLLNLINNTLDFAGVESGKSLLKIEELSLDYLVKKVWLLAKEIGKNKDIKLELESTIKSKEKKFFGDQERLEQILLNLLENAIKFTHDGGKVIFRISQENNEIIFQIEDTGVGINENQFPLLFNKFQQLENYRTKTNAGTGLGLALSKHLVELHGGRIEVESLIEKGSIFTVRIPDIKPIKKVNYLNKYQQDYSGNKTVLIISQNEEITTFICELLIVAEYQVIWLCETMEIVSKIKVFEPKLVILEGELTILTNNIIEQLRILKDTKQNELKILIILEEINSDDPPQVWQSIVDDYLLQPLQPNILLETIKNLMIN